MWLSTKQGRKDDCTRPNTSGTPSGHWSPVPSRRRNRARLSLVPYCSPKPSHSTRDNVTAQDTCNERCNERPRLPFLSRTESQLAGDLFSAGHQHRADSQLRTQEAKASLLTRPDPVLQAPAHPAAPPRWRGRRHGSMVLRLQVGDTGSQRRQRGTTTVWPRPTAPRRDPARHTARSPTPPTSQGPIPVKTSRTRGHSRARSSRAGCRKLQFAGRKLRPQAGPSPLAPAPPPPRATEGRRSSHWAPERPPRPRGTLGTLAGPTICSRGLSGGPRSPGSHLLALWSPSPSCSRRGRRARHTLRFLPRSRAI